MGYTSYSLESRSSRAQQLNYSTATVDTIFEQQKLHSAHKDMLPKNVTFREARDSEAHPNVVPIVIGLDVTGSMGMIPENLVREGLPKLVSSIIEAGIPDPALLFVAVGDHECDSFPLQVAQFESGDAELDMWLTRTYIERGGGGNAGESYGLVWYFAANHTKTDAFQNRGKKGYIITVGDEPILKNYPKSALNKLMGDSLNMEKIFYTREELLEQAQKMYNVFHISIEHGFRTVSKDWKELLGPHLIVTHDYTEVPNLIAKIIIEEELKSFPQAKVEETSKKDTIEIL